MGRRNGDDQCRVRDGEGLRQTAGIGVLPVASGLSVTGAGRPLFIQRANVVPGAGLQPILGKNRLKTNGMFRLGKPSPSAHGPPANRAWRKSRKGDGQVPEAHAAPATRYPYKTPV